jgi:hypothetical protein
VGCGYRVAGIRRVVLAQQTRCGPVRPVESALLWCSLSLKHVYEVRPRIDHRGVDLISDVLPFGRLWYGEPNAISNAIGNAMHSSRSHDAVIRVYDDGGQRDRNPLACGRF